MLSIRDSRTSHHVRSIINRITPPPSNITPTRYEPMELHFSKTNQISDAKMPPTGARALPRTVFLYDLRDPSTLLGGLVLTHGVTNANFYLMVDILLVSSTYFLRKDGKSEKLPRDNNALLPGIYFIVADGMRSIIVGILFC